MGNSFFESTLGQYKSESHLSSTGPNTALNSETTQILLY